MGVPSGRVKVHAPIGIAHLDGHELLQGPWDSIDELLLLGRLGQGSVGSHPTLAQLLKAGGGDRAGGGGGDTEPIHSPCILSKPSAFSNTILWSPQNGTIHAASCGQIISQL